MDIAVFVISSIHADCDDVSLSVTKCVILFLHPQDLDLFVKHLNQPLCNNESGNHGNNYDKMNNMETQATDDRKSADASNVDIEIILPKHEQPRAGTKAKLSDVDIVKLAPGENLVISVIGLLVDEWSYRSYTMFDESIVAKTKKLNKLYSVK